MIKRIIPLALLSIYGHANFANAAEPKINLNLSPVVVTGTRIEQNSFDLPMSIDVTDAEQIQDGQLKVNLSESAARVSGVVVNNRNNPAQDLAIQIRGFGARSAFGVRGVRLYADGIPMTMPDGQGQTGTFNLDTASRVEYLKGPFSSLYGNSSGGVVQIFTQDGPKVPTVSAGISFGSYNTTREYITAGTSGENFDAIFNLNTYKSDGYRDQSDMRRDNFHGKINFKLNEDTKLTIVATALDQTDNGDPQGLTAAQVRANPKQANPNSILFNTRVTKRHQQIGATLEHKLTENDTLRFMAYYGNRDNEQYQSLSVYSQLDDRSGGAVPVIARKFGGIDTRWTHNGIWNDHAYNFTVGMNYDHMEDDRKGYQNFISSLAPADMRSNFAPTSPIYNRTTCGSSSTAGESPIVCGVKGLLVRNEINTVSNFDQFIQGAFDINPKWTVNGGLRHTKVKFNNDDKYTNQDIYTWTGSNKTESTPRTNGDDSGSITHQKTTPVVGTIYKLTDTFNIYANAGESFETPTFAEMAYKATDGSGGLNLSLKPAKSRQFEVGIKTLIGESTLLNASVYKIFTDDEIVVQQQGGGRSVFQNIDKSERKGFELSADSRLGNGFSTYLAYTYLDAEFKSDFQSCKPFTGTQVFCSATDASHIETIKSGGKIPGTYKHTFFGELAWRHLPSGFVTALEARAMSNTIVAYDSGYGQAHGYGLAAWRASLTQNINKWKFNEFVRIDNLLDKEYVGSVRVGDLNSNYYEPAPGRTWLMGLSASYMF